jgi:hypothetical protein
MKLVLTLLAPFLVFSIQAYVFQKNSTGSNLQWRGRPSLQFIVNPTNSSAISDSEVISIIQKSMNSWGGTNAPSLSQSTSFGAPKSGQNDIYFSNSGLFFSGGSVIAVTQSTFEDRTATVLEADIIINDSHQVSGSEGDFSTDFLGDVTTHELGHAFGLDHSPVLYSTMFYLLNNGQVSVSEDDQIGANNIYGVKNTGSLSGTIAGGRSAVPVFGAHVQIISALKGKVIASVLSKDDGNFEVKDLPLDDIYYIYIEPMKIKDTVSTHFGSIQNNFCTGGSTFKGSFFESCRKSREGRPEGIKLSGSTQSKNVGIITVRCGLNIPNGYFQARGSFNFPLAVEDNYPGEALVGFFLQDDISNNRPDEFSIDLSQYSVTSTDLYLEVKTVSHDFYSQLELALEIENSDTSLSSSGIEKDSDGNPRLNQVQRFPLDSLDPSKNNFVLKVTPSELLFTGEFQKEHFFKDSDNLIDINPFYFLIAQVVRKDGSSYVLHGHRNYSLLQGNRSCMEANETYRVTSNSTLKDSSIEQALSDKKEGSEIAACGSIDLNNGPPSNGPFSMLLGMFIVVFFVQVFGRLRPPSSL